MATEKNLNLLIDHNEKILKVRFPQKYVCITFI